ncbi:serine-rich aggregation substance UasX [Leuconostoc gelidum subsp. gasicomitatum]|uniref:serine-rich aggregation substance UasX n=1 Tax=Leuconostoc gasicomitatum TaxID=115778 RepID=UPI001CC72CEA|nr:serine-rich aggregation substance UasX [Leuconostoc gasicomitatum]MBZ5961366.1 serine-rich aggregation substance UasX [Leuconostoc gasicomitatum]MBZ5994648.1 serine-rich aggregation substance UasX [Leuconostoc gasicomitatum]
MLKKTVILSTAVLGALIIGNQAIHADTVDVNDGTNTGTSQPAMQPSDNSNTALPPTSSNTDTDSSHSETGSSGVDDGTTIDNGGSSSSSTDTDTGSSSSHTDNGSGSSSSNTDNGNNSSSSNIETGSNSSTSNTDNSSSSNTTNDDTKLPVNGQAPDPVPLTPNTPDVNDQEQLNQVAPIAVQQSNQGQAPIVPEQVATVPSVARAIQTYNETLAKNNSDDTKTPVIAAKKKVDEAVQKALPKTGIREKQSSVSVLGLALGALVSGLAFVFKKKLS